MKFLNVLQSFKLNLADGIRDFEAGLQEVEDEIAEHWYVKANTETVTAKQAKAIQAASTTQATDAAADTSTQADTATTTTTTTTANTETVTDATGA
ncbi:STY1053 family phage-associated protein [Pseudomonas yamanorum]